MNRFKTIAIYSVLGPIIGSVIFGVLFNIFALIEGDFRADMLWMILLAIPFGFFVGIIPAAITGVIVCLLQKGRGEKELITISAGVGFISVFVIFLFTFVSFKSGLNMFIGTLVVAVLFGLLGAVAGYGVAKVYFKSKSNT